MSPRDAGYLARFNAVHVNPYVLPWRRAAWWWGWRAADRAIKADGTVVP